jgi:hypothetical protein
MQDWQKFIIADQCVGISGEVQVYTRKFSFTDVEIYRVNIRLEVCGR